MFSRLHNYCMGCVLSRGSSARWYHHLVCGLGVLPYYGSHPGLISVLILMVILGLVGFIRGGLVGFIFSIIFGCFVYVPILIWSSISRSRDHVALVERRNAAIERALFSTYD